jgi:beta-lactamase class A
MGYAEAPAAVALADKTLARVRLVEARTSGVLGFCAIDLTTGDILAENSDMVFAQASSIKVPLMIQVFASIASGRLSLDRKFTIEPSESVGGSGHLKSLLRSGPATLTLEELITAMIETSDNTATNKLIALVGMDSVNRMLDTLGLKQTRLRRIMLDSEAARRGDENVSTPCEMARLMEMVYRGKTVDSNSSKRMMEILKLVEADFRAVIPAGIPIAAKPGGIPGVRCESGIVFLDRRPFVMSVMSAFLDTGENPVKDVARILFEHYEKLAGSNRYGHKTY